MDIPRPTPLVRQTNAYWGLSQRDRLRWDAAATVEEREAIVQEHRTRSGLDDIFGMAAGALEQGAEGQGLLWEAAAAAPAAAEQVYEPENNLEGDMD